jgi:hypothetical protein
MVENINPIIDFLGWRMNIAFRNLVIHMFVSFDVANLWFYVYLIHCMCIIIVETIYKFFLHYFFFMHVVYIMACGKVALENILVIKNKNNNKRFFI